MSVLDDIVAGVQVDLAERQALVSEGELRAAVAGAAPTRDPMPAFRSPGLSVIAEVKRRSPSKGDLADIPDPAALASAYAAGGAAPPRGGGGSPLLGAARAPPIRRQPRRPARRPGRGGHPAAAQGLHR